MSYIENIDWKSQQDVNQGGNRSEREREMGTFWWCFLLFLRRKLVDKGVENGRDQKEVEVEGRKCSKIEVTVGIRVIKRGTAGKTRRRHNNHNVSEPLITVNTSDFCFNRKGRCQKRYQSINDDY